MNSFYINKAGVDTDRRVVFIGGETVSLEPKVFKVLQYLASNPGRVISHQELLDTIWANTVVEPVALQRCIARLRRVFGDDARKQSVIATYPKRGYSLVAEVHWQDFSEDEISPWWTLSRRFAAAAAVILVLVIVASYMFQPVQPAATAALAEAPDTELSLLNNSALVTALANPDDFPVYSPDGRYVVYPRYLEEGRAHLWARDLAYGNDFMLTDEAGRYEHLAWSMDSSMLVFADAANHCSSLKAVAVSQSESNALLVNKLIDCMDSRIVAPEWLNNRTLAFIAINESGASLQKLDLKKLNTEELLSSSNQVPYHLSFSRQTNILTIMAIDEAGQKELLFLDTNSGLINRNVRAVFPPEENFYPSSTPL